VHDPMRPRDEPRDPAAGDLGRAPHEEVPEREEVFPAPLPDEPAPPPTEEASLSAFFARRVPAFRVFRFPHYRLLWISNVLSSTGNWMQNAVFGVLILKLTGSPFLTAFIPVAPQVVMGPLSAPAGLLADRRNRRNLLIVTQAMFAVLTAGIGFLVLTGRESAGAFLAINFVMGAFMAVNFPAYQALFPRLVPREELPNAVALNSVTFNLARIVGPSLGAAIYKAWGEGEVFLLNAVTYLAFALVLFRIPKEAGQPIVADARDSGSMADGFRFARRNKTVGTMILGIAVISIFGLPVIFLAPLQAQRVFGRPEDAGFILTAMGVGAVVGALASGSASIDRKPRWGIISYMVFALSLAGFALVSVPVASLVLIAVFGFAYMGASVVINSLVQLATPDRLRGRVMSLYSIAWVGFLPVGVIVAGAIAQAVGGTSGATVAMLIGAGVCGLFALRLALRRDWIPQRFEATGLPSPVSE
jgi:MFS family permease